MLRSLRCPHCGDQAVTVWRKLEMGPRIWSACFSCGKPVTTRWWASILATLAGLAIIILSFQFESWTIRISVIIFGIMLVVVIQLFLVPLQHAMRRNSA
jgi:DNA-directed RNA polymerase subunit N (RpoN/RPB10)